MCRLMVAIVLSSVTFAQNAPDGEISRAAKSPYDLAKYINSHDEIEWKPLWQALGIEAPSGIECSMNCKAELIAVQNPDQVILLVNATLPRDVYLRYQREESGMWQFTGKYYANVWDGNPHRRNIVRAGSTQFLVVSTHGGHGSDLDEEMQDWLDLSQPGLEPVFSHLVHGGERRPYGYTLEMTGDAFASRTGITYRVRLFFTGFGCVLGDLSLEATYARTADPRFLIQGARLENGPAIPTGDFQDLARVGQASDQQLFRYSLPHMTEIASAGDPKQKECLSDYLSHAARTPETEQLLKLLAKP